MKLFLLIPLLYFVSACSGKPSDDKVIAPVTKSDSLTNNGNEVQEEVQEKLSLQNISIYVLYAGSSADSSKTTLISLSDSYPWDESASTRKLPDIESLGIENAAYFIPPKKYRNNFLSKVGISETDTLFAYDYTKNILYKFAVSRLPFAAELSLYTDESSWPYSEDDYQLGFEIKKSAIRKSDENAELLVVIGKENPFNVGGMKPARWKKVASRKEKIKMSDPCDPKTTLTYVTGQKYGYQADGYNYIVLELTDGDRIARQLTVNEISSGKIVCKRLFRESESASLSELNGLVATADDWLGQWTGSLFKNKPPVIFGFQSFSFGCSSIIFLDTETPEITLKCDNRH